MPVKALINTIKCMIMIDEIAQLKTKRQRNTIDYDAVNNSYCGKKFNIQEGIKYTNSSE